MAGPAPLCYYIGPAPLTHSRMVSFHVCARRDVQVKHLTLLSNNQELKIAVLFTVCLVFALLWEQMAVDEKLKAPLWDTYKLTPPP